MKTIALCESDIIIKHETLFVSNFKTEKRHSADSEILIFQHPIRPISETRKNDCIFPHKKKELIANFRKNTKGQKVEQKRLN